MDGLFTVNKGESLSVMYAPVNGIVIPQSEIPDEVFSSGMLGEGIGIKPSDGNFVSPVKGRVVDITPTAHAYSLLADDGTELLLHIGIDTVEMKGNGFLPLLKVGDRIDVGTPLAKVDLGLIKNEGYSDITALIIINYDALSQMTVFEGDCKAGNGQIIKYVKEKK